MSGHVGTGADKCQVDLTLLDATGSQVGTKKTVTLKAFEPSLPKAIPTKGFPVLFVDAFGTELQFSSVDEVVHFLEVIGQKNMPTSLQLTRRRNEAYGPNKHWLSRLPADLKPWRKRERLLPIINEGLAAFKAVCR